MMPQPRQLANRLRASSGLAAILALSTLGACATPGPDLAGPGEEGRFICVEPRPEVCTMDYNPVCATHADGTSATYPNGCGACADAAVVSHRPGACE
jgi:hypothetical protein